MGGSWFSVDGVKRLLFGLPDGTSPRGSRGEVPAKFTVVVRPGARRGPDKRASQAHDSGGGRGPVEPEGSVGVVGVESRVFGVGRAAGPGSERQDWERERLKHRWEVLRDDRGGRSPGGLGG